jgi:hypothetical protein
MLRPDALREDALGLALEVRLPWYRSLPLSCVESIELSLNGRPVSCDDLLVAVDGCDRRVTELEPLEDRPWFVRDPIALKAPWVVEAGEEIDVRLRVRLRIPYILIGPDTALSQTTERSERLVVRPAQGATPHDGSPTGERPA